MSADADIKNMDNIFFSILNAGIYGSVMIVAVLFIRGLFRKAPGSFLCALWMIVGIRLLIPLSLSVPFGIMPSDGFVSGTGYAPGRDAVIVMSEDIRRSIYKDHSIPDYRISSGLRSGLDENADILSLGSRISDRSAIVTGSPEAGAPGRVSDDISTITVLEILYLSGVVFSIVILLVGYIRMRYTLGDATAEEININGESIRVYRSPDHTGACVFGLFDPRIYIPSSVDDEDASLVAEHERTHICRGDHIAKALFCFILVMHWYNPLVWAAYYCYGVDIETACDERMVRSLDENMRNKYAHALLHTSSGEGRFPSPQVMFSEVPVRDRIGKIFGYVRHGKRIYMLCAVLCICLVITGFCGRDVQASVEGWQDIPQGMDDYVPDESGFNEYHSEHYDLYPNDYYWGYVLYKDGRNMGFFSFNDPILVRTDSGELWMYNYYLAYDAYIPLKVDEELKADVTEALGDDLYWNERDEDAYIFETDSITGLSYMYEDELPSWTAKVILNNDRDAQIFSSLSEEYKRRYSPLLSDIEVASIYAGLEIMGRCFRDSDGFVFFHDKSVQSIDIVHPENWWSVTLRYPEYDLLYEWMRAHPEGFKDCLLYDSWKPVFDELGIDYFDGTIDESDPRYGYALKHFEELYGGSYPPDVLDEYHADMQIFNYMKEIDENGDLL